jgi:hypothetical protein
VELVMNTSSAVLSTLERQRPFLNGQAVLAAPLDGQCASDALQCTGVRWRRDNRAVENDEHVGASALTELASGVA